MDEVGEAEQVSDAELFAFVTLPLTMFSYIRPTSKRGLTSISKLLELLAAAVVAIGILGLLWMFMFPNPPTP
jgi:hypothetical protein